MLTRRVSAFVLIVAVTAAGACKRAERAAEEAAQAAAAQAQSILTNRDEKQLQAALRKLQEVAAHGDSAVVYTIANQFDVDYSRIATQTDQRIAGYPIRKRFVMTKQQASSIVEVLTERKTYFPAGDGWTCMFEPRHILQIAASNDKVTVVICVKCGDVEFILGEDSIGTRSVLPPANAGLSRILNELRDASIKSSGKPAA
jgi:hypothetical protein